MPNVDHAADEPDREAEAVARHLLDWARRTLTAHGMETNDAALRAACRGHIKALRARPTPSA
jgi:hypothetical protein